MSSARRACLSLLVLLSALACGDGRSYWVHGVVREVFPDERQALIQHEDVPGLMSAMTMSFDVPDPAVFEKLVPGESVRFRLVVSEKEFRITEVQREGEAAAGASRSPSLASVLRGGEPAPVFSLSDQNGEPLSLGDLRGRFALIDFIYTRCPGPCPILTAQHVALQRELSAEQREQIRLVSISLDPAHDTPEALLRYARERGADLEGWSFLTGPTDQVGDVVKRFGVGTLLAPDGTIDHVVATFLVDRQGRIVKRWLGVEHQVAEKLAVVAALLDGDAG